MIDKDVVQNTISMHKVTAAPEQEESLSKTAQIPMSFKIETPKTEEKEKNRTLASLSKVPTSSSEYAVDCIVGQSGHDRN